MAMETLIRLPDWRPRLAAAVEARRRRPYSATENCGLFVADCILAMTGTDLAADFREHLFASLDAALDAVRASGHADVCALAAAHLPEIHPSRARLGDVMAFAAPETGWALGIVTGDRVAVLRSDGLGTVSRDRGARAFRVG
jgi:hypothetical protein